MGAGASLIWLVGVRASMRPLGTMLAGVWRAIEDICLDACQKRHVKVSDHGQFKTMCCAQAVFDDASNLPCILQALIFKHQALQHPRSARGRHRSKEVRGMPVSQEQRRPWGCRAMLQQPVQERVPACASLIWHQRSVGPAVFWAALGRPGSLPCLVCPHQAAGTSAKDLVHSHIRGFHT